MSARAFNGDGARDNAVLSRVHEKRTLNQPLNLRELSEAYGITYYRARSLSFEAGFPIVRGLVFPQAFEAWMTQGQRSRSSEDPQPSGAGKARGRALSCGSPIAWQQLAQSLHAAGLSPE